MIPNGGLPFSTPPDPRGRRRRRAREPRTRRIIRAWQPGPAEVPNDYGVVGGCGPVEVMAGIPAGTVLTDQAACDLAAWLLACACQCRFRVEDWRTLIGRIKRGEL